MYGLFGPFGPEWDNVNFSTTIPDVQVLSPPNCDGFGLTVLLVDLDEDGYDDLLIGSPQAKPATQDWAGGVGVLFGRPDPPAEWVVDWAVTPPLLSFIDDVFYLQLGAALAAGDFDGDGHVDLIIGSDSYDQPGAISILRGPLEQPGSPTMRDLAAQPPDWLLPTPGHAADGFGSVMAVGDIDGDQRADLAAGAPLYFDDDICGAAFAYFGRAFESAAETIDPDVVITAGGPTEYLKLGAGVAIGDYTADGNADLLVSDPFYVVDEEHRGLLAVIDHARLSAGADISLADSPPDLSLIGLGDWWFFFEAVHVMQTVGNGAEPAILFTVPNASWAGITYSGAAIRLDRSRLGAGPVVSLADVDVNTLYYGSTDGFFFGQFAQVVNLDGNDVPDLILGAEGGAPASPLKGVVAVFFDQFAAEAPTDDDDDDDDDNNDDNDDNDNDNDNDNNDDNDDDDNNDDNDTANDDEPSADDDDDGGCGC